MLENPKLGVPRLLCNLHEPEMDKLDIEPARACDMAAIFLLFLSMPNSCDEAHPRRLEVEDEMPVYGQTLGIRKIP